VKLNKGGLKFCAVYVCFFVLLSALAIMARDPKGAWVLGQLSVLPGLFFLEVSGLTDLLVPYFKDYPWLNSGLVSFPVSLAIVYFLGWGIAAFSAFIRHADDKLPQRVEDGRDPRER
jgi:hypothetical protein